MTVTPKDIEHSYKIYPNIDYMSTCQYRHEVILLHNKTRLLILLSIITSLALIIPLILSYDKMSHIFYFTSGMFVVSIILIVIAFTFSIEHIIIIRELSKLIK